LDRSFGGGPGIRQIEQRVHTSPRIVALTCWRLEKSSFRALLFGGLT
jgi:hypothetical protein